MPKRVYLEKIFNELELGNNGVRFQVRNLDTNAHRGYLQIGRAYVSWFKGKSAKPTKRVHIDKFIESMEECGAAAPEVG